MKTRDFDPVLSAALRRELEALPEHPDTAPSRRPALRRPQVWITAATALVLLVAVVGVLRFGALTPQPADPGSPVVDPLTSVTDPTDASYVARRVEVVLHVRGVGPGTHAFAVPAGTGQIAFYLACSPSGSFSVDLDDPVRTESADRGTTTSSGGCDRTVGSSFSLDLKPGTHTASVHLPDDTRYALLGIRLPGPTIAAGGLIDPLTAVRDLRNPDALTGSTRPVIRVGGTGDRAAAPFAVPAERLRVYFACTPSSAAARAVVDGHVVAGCMNSIAHWFDFTPSSRSITASVSGGSTRWSLLAVPAPVGAADSPANTLLPYPALRSEVLARARGAGAPASGTYTRRSSSIGIEVACRGTGWLEVQTGDGGTTTRGTSCRTRSDIGLGGPDAGPVEQHWRAIPHGDVSWTLQIVEGG